ncbi:MAG: hypothetical protein AABX38_03415 [Candidatus Micrarchaeota archaeon]
MKIKTKSTNKNIVILASFLLFLTLLNATTIYGDIINGENFELINNTIIKIEGVGTTQFIANQNYLVQLSEGNYNISASYFESGKLLLYSKDPINVMGNETNFDIVLLAPDQIDDILDNYQDLPNENEIIKGNLEDYRFLIIGLIGLAIAIYILVKKLGKTQAIETSNNKTLENKNDNDENIEEQGIIKEKPDEEISRIVKIMQDNEGRILQRELRQILNFSETKMSLIISEMEVLGLIKRIKKGRENILKLIKAK